MRLGSDPPSLPLLETREPKISACPGGVGGRGNARIARKEGPGGGAEPTAEALPWAAERTGFTGTRSRSPIQGSRNFREAQLERVLPEATGTEGGASDERCWGRGDAGRRQAE